MSSRQHNKHQRSQRCCHHQKDFVEVRSWFSNEISQKKTWALNGSKVCVNSTPYLLDYKIENLCPYQIAILMVYFMNGISWKHVFPIIQRISGDSFTLIENTEFSTSPRSARQSHRAGRSLQEWYVAVCKLGWCSWWCQFARHPSVGTYMDQAIWTNPSNQSVLEFE